MPDEHSIVPRDNYKGKALLLETILYPK